MSESLQLIAIDAIDADALIRDRTVVDEEALGELRASIAAGGLRMPVEVFALAEPAEGRTHGLISGLRRLTAVRALRAETGAERWAAIPAFVRAPKDLAAALAEVVEENEVRADVSAWEQGSFALAAQQQEIFATVDEAIDRLHPGVSAVRRARLRAFALVAGELMHHFSAPERLGQREMMRLAAACRAGFAEDLRFAIADAPFREQGAQWRAVLPVLAEAEAAASAPGVPARGGGRRVLHLDNGWTVRREKVTGGYRLLFSGRDATLEWVEGIFFDLEMRFAPPDVPRVIGKRRW